MGSSPQAMVYCREQVADASEGVLKALDHIHDNKMEQDLYRQVNEVCKSCICLKLFKVNQGSLPSDCTCSDP